MRQRSLLDLVDDLGTYQLQEADPIERPKPVDLTVNRPRRKDVWPVEVFEEMQAIYAEKTDG